MSAARIKCIAATTFTLASALPAPEPIVNGPAASAHQDIPRVHKPRIAAEGSARCRHQLRAPQFAVPNHEIRELLRLHPRCGTIAAIC